jgi:hypothetical protein
MIQDGVKAVGGSVPTPNRTTTLFAAKDILALGALKPPRKWIFISIDKTTNKPERRWVSN